LYLETVTEFRVIYILTLITAILIIAYKRLNNIDGYKITKLEMANDLENDLIAQIVVLCGGNPQKILQKTKIFPLIHVSNTTDL